MSEEIPEDAMAEAARTGVARLPDGGLLMGMPLAGFDDACDPDAPGGAQPASEGTTVAELAQLAFDAFWASPALGGEPPSPLGKESAGIREAWEAAVSVVAARVADPSAEDYDNAAEIMRLRDVLTEIFTCIRTGDPALLFDGEQVAEWCERSGFEFEACL